MFLIFRFGKAEPSSKHKRHCQRVEVMLSAGPLNTALVLMGSRHVRDIYALHRCLLYATEGKALLFQQCSFFCLCCFSFILFVLYLYVFFALHIWRIINYLSIYLSSFP